MSDGWHNIEKQRDSNGNPTAVAKAIQAIIDNGCDCDDRDGKCGGKCFPGLCEAAIHEQFDEIARLRAAMAPREPSPDLAEAELRLRAPIDEVKGSDARAIAAELDRLRGALTLASIEQSQETTLVEARAAADVWCLQDEIADLRAEVARLSQPAPAQPDELARLRAENAQLKAEMEDMVNTGSKHDAFMARLQSAVEPLLPAPVRDLAEFKALRDFCACLNVCHVCGVVLDDPGADDSIAAYTRCEQHANAVDDEEDGEEWHISRDTWKYRYAAAARIITAGRAGKDGTGK